jgi:hypothetical protein
MQYNGWLETTFQSTGGKLLLILLGVILTWVLSSPWIKRGFGWIVEPNVEPLFKEQIRRRPKNVLKQEEY